MAVAPLTVKMQSVSAVCVASLAVGSGVLSRARIDVICGRPPNTGTGRRAGWNEGAAGCLCMCVGCTDVDAAQPLQLACSTLPHLRRGAVASCDTARRFSSPRLLFVCITSRIITVTVWTKKTAACLSVQECTTFFILSKISVPVFSRLLV